LRELNENGSLSPIEPVIVSGTLMEDMIEEEEEQEQEEQESVKPEGEDYHLRVLRNGQVFPMDLTLPGEATLTDLYQTLESLLGVGVMIRTMKRIFQKDSKEVLTELNLKNLLLDVVVNVN
jgi:hypothetical protein